jgi:hypothetical protein
VSDKPKGYVYSLPGRVVHATLAGKRRWIIGCTFDCPLSPRELQTFLGG